MTIRQLRWRTRMALGGTLLYGGLAIYVVGMLQTEIYWPAVIGGCAIGVPGLFVLYMGGYRN